MRNLGVGETYRRNGRCEVHLFDRHIPRAANAKYFLKGLIYAGSALWNRGTADAGPAAGGRLVPVRPNVPARERPGLSVRRETNCFMMAVREREVPFVDTRHLTKVDPARALTEIDKLLNRYPEHPHLMWVKAKVLSRLRRWRGAETLYEKIIEIGAYEDAARNGLAKSIAKQGRLGEAEALYRETLQDFPDSVPTYCGLAHVLISQKELAEALKIIDRVVSRQGLEPDNIVAAVIKTKVMLLQGQSPEECHAFLLEVLEGNGYAYITLKRLEDRLRGLQVPDELWGDLHDLIGYKRSLDPGAFKVSLSSLLLKCLRSARPNGLTARARRGSNRSAKFAAPSAGPVRHSSPAPVPEPIPEPIPRSSPPAPRETDPAAALAAVQTLIKNPRKRNFVSILRQALADLKETDQQELAEAATKPELQRVHSFLAAPPRELKRSFKQLDRETVAQVKARLIGALKA